MAPPALELHGLTFSYDGFREILHGISLELERGEIAGLLGPNGAGKSTTIKIVTGILAPGAGTVRVLGLALPENAVRVKRRIGYVPEAAALFETLTGQEFLELAGRLHDVEERTLQHRIGEFLEVFDLMTERSSRLDTYSKGMRQKILIAAALLHNPDLLLLDEPLSGLDPNAALLVKELIAELAASGKTVLYSSHVLDVVERVCDRVLIVNDGRLVAQGSPESLRAATGQPTLEAAFRSVTDAGGPSEAAKRIVAALA